MEARSDAARFETRGFGVAVTLIGPGPVHSCFAEEATAVPATVGPYARFRRGVAERNAGSYRAGAWGTITPEDAAEVLEPPAAADEGVGRAAAPQLPGAITMGRPVSSRRSR